MKKTELEFRRDGGLYKTDAKTLKDVIATAPPHEREKLEQGLGHKDPPEGPQDEAKRMAGNEARLAAARARGGHKEALGNMHKSAAIEAAKLTDRASSAGSLARVAGPKDKQGHKAAGEAHLEGLHKTEPWVTFCA